MAGFGIFITDNFDDSNDNYKEPEDLEIGDHLVFDRGIYEHHAIYVSNHRFIHYLDDEGITYGSIDDDEYESYTIRKHPWRMYSRKESVRRAKSRLGESDYNLLFNNCEHFVSWCILGVPICEQRTIRKRLEKIPKYPPFPPIMTGQDMGESNFPWLESDARDGMSNKTRKRKPLRDDYDDYDDSDEEVSGLLHSLDKSLEGMFKRIF